MTAPCDLLVVRADGGSASGLGHLVRSLAIAEAAIAAGWRVSFVTAEMPEAMASRAQAREIEIQRLTSDPGGALDAVETAGFNPGMTVVDGYHFRAEFYAQLEALRSPHIVVADAGTAATAPFALVNQNPNAHPEMYAHLPGSTHLLLGLRYALLRTEICSATRASPRRDDPVVFMSIGGSDPLGLSLPLAEALSDRDVVVHLALGDGLPGRTTIESRLTSVPKVTVVPPHEFVSRFTSSALAVIGAGGTMWEAAFLGVPAMALVVADNQAEPSIAAEAIGFLQRVDCRRGADVNELADETVKLLADPRGLHDMSMSGPAAVDGQGCRRVVDHLDAWSRTVRGAS